MGDGVDRGGGGPDEPIDPELLGVAQPVTPVRLGSTFLPAQRVPEGASEVHVEIRGLHDGRTALFAYSSLPRLVQCCGPVQPWVEVAPGRVHDVQRMAGVDVVVWDAELPTELWQTADDEQE